MKHILFVCTGNTCRSSMAEGFLKDAITNADSLKGNFTVSSAGIYANNGESASEYSIEVLKRKWGIDISLHHAKQLSYGDIKTADLILTMTQSHKSLVISQYPDAKGKTYVLKEYISDICGNIIGKNVDIIDPYGAPLYVYEICADEIKDVVEKLAKKLGKGVI